MTTTFQQEERGFMTYPRSRWRRLMFKSPVTFWRLGLGPILGRVMMVLTTTGRKSGLARHTMVEYFRLGNRKYVACAFGEKAQWYKNITADPHVTIQTSDGVERMIATRVTDDDELLEVFGAFKRRYPVGMLDWYLKSLDIRPDPADILAKKDRIYWLRFDPTDEPTPPPLEADLKWVWPAAVLGFVSLRRLRQALRSPTEPAAQQRG